jgi:rubrerythrin
MNELNYPEHHHPHGVENTKPNDNRVWVCTECQHLFSDDELRNDIECGHCCKQHPCRKGQRCESHLEPFVPELGGTK